MYVFVCICISKKEAVSRKQAAALPVPDLAWSLDPGPRIGLMQRECSKEEWNKGKPSHAYTKVDEYIDAVVLLSASHRLRAVGRYCVGKRNRAGTRIDVLSISFVCRQGRSTVRIYVCVCVCKNVAF